MTFIEAASPRQFRAIAFKRAPTTPDFACSERVMLPGKHSAEAARATLNAALRGPEGKSYIGGEIQSFDDD